jgi:hypothetical protein
VRIPHLFLFSRGDISYNKTGKGCDSMIEVTNLTKEFVKYEKEKGLKGLLKGFFNAKKVVNKADISEPTEPVSRRPSRC